MREWIKKLVRVTFLNALKSDYDVISSHLSTLLFMSPVDPSAQKVNRKFSFDLVKGLKELEY